jgi:hypothetical protein
MKLIFALLITGMVLVSGCTQQDWQTQESRLSTGAVDLSGFEPEKTTLTKHYTLDSLDVTLGVPQYNLPLQTGQFSNYGDFSSKLSLSPGVLELLGQNGFVVIQNPFNPQEEDITTPYETLEQREIPVFITSDSLLHLYHIQFDETLRQIEEREFYDRIWDISRELFDDSAEKYQASTGELNEASRRNAAYFAVGLELLKPKPDQVQEECAANDWQCQMQQTDEHFSPEEAAKYQFTVPSFVNQEVAGELALIETHNGFSESPLFVYNEDYSQYIPRGHYTRSDKLKNYFRAMMWYGRISMLLKGTDQVGLGESCRDIPPCTAIISLEDARLQTMGASLIASRFAGSQDLKDRWDRIYTVTAFYVGLSDDLGPYEYIEALDAVFGSPFDPNDLTGETIGELKAKLAEYRTPEIYGGTGYVALWPPFSPEQADEILEVTKGFRLMGQRFIPDSYMFQNLVFPRVDSPLGPEQPFTWVMTPGGPTRGFPRGLDVMALLGSERARELLDELGDSSYVNYTVRFNELQEEFDAFTDADWNRNLYWSWLYALKPLLKDFGEGYPTFMQTQAWHEKELTTALASWTELRHDTILYAKQSYTPVKEVSVPQEKPVVGYVEPVPEFYNRLLALTRMTTQGLDSMDVLDDTSRARLQSLERILERLIEISIQELGNQELSQDDYDFIKGFGEQLNGVIADVEDMAKKTTIVADVHTDSNTKKVLEEGVGYVDMMVVAYTVPDGRILLGAGPVMTYYEFKHPMEDRLTDDAWRDMLQEEPPEKPEWIPNFSA